MSKITACISRRGTIIIKDLVSIGRGSISVAVGTIAGAVSSGGHINWKTLLTTAGATILMNIAQRIGGTSVYPVSSSEQKE